MLKTLAVLAFAAFLVVPAVAESRQPPRQNGQQQTGTEQRGSEADPVFVKVIPPTQSKADLDREKAKEDAISSDTKRLTDFTGDLVKYTKKLAYGTFALAALTAGLLILGALQFRGNNRSITAAENAANAAAAQVKLGRDEFNATFRPRLMVRHVSLGTPQVPFTSRPNVGDKIIGSLVVVNRGSTRATVVESRYLIFFSLTGEGLPMLSPMEESWGELIPANTDLEAGESSTFRISGSVVLDRQIPDSFIRITAGTWAVYVMGQIRYRDVGGNERFMGFCRRWLGESTFEPVPNFDYEYED